MEEHEYRLIDKEALRKARQAYKWDLRFLDLAGCVATWSKDPSTMVGAVIVRPDRTVASLGFNGFPRSMPDHADQYADREEKLSRVIHGEMNAVLFAQEPLHGYTLYTHPFIPCDRCVVHMAQAGIKRIVAPWVDPESPRGQRWADAFEKTRRYVEQCGITLAELRPE